MEWKRINDLEEDGCDLKKCRNKFTEVQSMPNDDARDTYFDEPLSNKYQPQFFNYQLIGDLVAVGILNSKDLIIKQTYYTPVQPITQQRFCNVAWSVKNLLHEMKSKKSCYPIAKKVLLSVGYNDYRSNVMNPDMFVECLKTTIKKLLRRGCKEIILANVPPSGMECDSINHWKYLQIINEEIFELSKKYDCIFHCDIFQLFCKPKNLFSPNKDYVTFSEINYKVDFAMYNEVGCDGEIDLSHFSNLAKIVLGKHVAKTVEKRVEYLRHGPVDKVICVLKEASDVDDSDSEVEAVEVVMAENANKCRAVNLDSSDEDMRRGDEPLKCKISRLLEKPDDINSETVSCEISLESERMEPVISSNIKSIDDIKVENKSSPEMHLEDERMKQVISCSIKRVGDGKVENSSPEMPGEDERMKQVISCSIKHHGVIRVENSSSETPPEKRMKHVISCSIERVDDTRDKKRSCEMFLEHKQPKQVISSNIVILSNFKDEKNSCELLQKDEEIKPEIVQNIEKSEPMKKEIVNNTERSNDINDGELSCGIPGTKGHFKQVILCNFKTWDPVVGKISCQIPQEDSQLRPAVLSSKSSNKKFNDANDEKPSGKEVSKEDSPFRQVILCSIRKVDVQDEASRKRKK